MTNTSKAGPGMPDGRIHGLRRILASWYMNFRRRRRRMEFLLFAMAKGGKQQNLRFAASEPK